MRYASYLSPQWGRFAQYCRSNAGSYRLFSRKERRVLEIEAHQNGVVQIPRLLLAKKGEGRNVEYPFDKKIQQFLIEAAK